MLSLKFSYCLKNPFAYVRKYFTLVFLQKKLANHMLKEKSDGESIKTKYIKWNKNKAVYTVKNELCKAHQIVSIHTLLDTLFWKKCAYRDILVCMAHFSIYSVGTK